uniref:Uncharacterized protein n=1 Tax=Ditylenchus dipsaci TaxID=166011 RepID=A0A915EK38_9BILA
MPREAPQFAYFSSAYEMVNMPLQPNVSTLMIRSADLSSLDRVKMMRVEPLASLIPQALVIEPSSELTFRVCIATLVLTNPSARTVFFKENLYPSKLSDIRQILLRI